MNGEKGVKRCMEKKETFFKDLHISPYKVWEDCKVVKTTFALKIVKNNAFTSLYILHIIYLVC